MTLMQLARYVLTPPRIQRLLDDTAAAMQAGQTVMESQAALIVKQHDRIQRMQLDHFLDMHGLVSAWLINLESPEIDIRDDLSRLERDLGNRIAALEEHVV